MNQIILETHQLDIGYHSRANQRPIASGLNLKLIAGKLTCLIGSNGVGKTTLLRTLAGLQKPRGGSLNFEGRPYSHFSPEELARRISVVLTDASHPGDLRVEQVVELGRLPYTNWLGALSESDRARVREALEQMQATGLTGRSFGQLSDGERQKVMIARALAQSPKVMLLDEPTAFLDWPNRVDLMMTLKRIAQTEEKAVLLSSHDLELVMRLADEIWLIDDQKQVQCGSQKQLLDNGALHRAFAGRYTRFSEQTEEYSQP